MDAPVEPPPCFSPFTTEANGLHYVWRGYGPGADATTIPIYDVDAPVEPPPCSCAFTTEANGLHYVWRGVGPEEDVTTIWIYNVLSEQWVVQPTTGPPLPGQYGGGCTTVMNHLYCFGGGYPYCNDLYKLNCQSFEWSKIHPRNEESLWPSKKAYCGLVSLDGTTLACFGGSVKSGFTNEFHLFDLKQGAIINVFILVHS